LHYISFQPVDILLIIIYFFLIGQISFYSISYRNRIVISFLLLLSFALKIVVGFYLNENAFYALQHRFLFSEYDATNYYLNSVFDIATQNTFIPDLHWSIADPGFNILLYWVGKIYSFCFHGLSISYFHFIYMLIFIHTLTFIYMFIQLEKDIKLYKNVIILFSVFMFFEPMMLRFAFSLEREIVVSLLLLIFIIAFMNNNIVLIIISSFILIMFREVYLYLIPTYIVSYLVFRKFFSGRIISFLCFAFVLFSLTVYAVSLNFESMETLFFQQGKQTVGSGFGAVIMSSNYFLRTILYSFLGFVAPVPIYPFFDKEFSTIYLFSFVTGLSSISYIFLNSYIIYSLSQFECQIDNKLLNINMLYNTIYKAYIVIFLSHLVFQGLIFNIRHRLQIIPGLVFVFLYILNIQSAHKELTIDMGKWFFHCVLLIVFLNIIYVVVKISL